MEGIVFSNLNEIVKNKEVLSDTQKKDLWSVMPYETSCVKGKALITGDSSHPADVILQPKLTGWHKVFVTSTRMDGGFSLLMKMDNVKHFTDIENCTQFPPKVQWWYNECVEEHFWCCADLSDREIILRKHKRSGSITTLVWLRCVPMTDEEIAAYKEYVSPDRPRNLHVHFDNDTNNYIGTDELEDFLHKNVAIIDTDTKICTQEIMDDYYDEEAYDEHDRCIWTHEINYNEANRKAAQKMNDVVKTRADFVHSTGAKLYAGFRACVGLSSLPFAPLMLWAITKKHPEWHVVTRDGRDTAISSFAYPEVRQCAIDYIKRSVARGHDGVSLITHRGIRCGFEQPVCDAFAKRHGGIDARRVPMSDPRIQEIWCEYFTEFVRELTKQLDEQEGRHVPINVITGFSPEASKRMGVDIEMLCKEGLIDHFCAEAMDHYEVEGDFIDEDGLIDLEKYKAYLADNFVVGRKIGESWDTVAEGTPKFIEIADKYGVEFFSGMSPVETSAANRAAWVDKLRSIGVKNFSFFNFCYSCQDRAVVHAAAKTAHERVPEFCTTNFYRVLSYDGIDISTYTPSWRA
ncbi:MAG: hypothetical protein IJZ08_05990 [Clostridia bacterium]|nr:hypothetical protein [Clostridia bacterium]